MRTHLPTGATRRWSLSLALAAALAALLLALTPSTDAQQPPAPHWFWGVDLDAYVGDEIRAVNQAGTVVARTSVGANGDWSIIVSTEDARTVKLRLITGSITRETDALDVIEGGFDDNGLSITDFKVVDDDLGDLQGDAETLAVRIIARRAPDGRVEFGMRPPVGDDIFPRARYFPATGPDHNRWLRSSEIDFGDGFVGRIIARRAPDSRVEFGFRVAGYDDLFPRARYFPATGPDHNRWLRSSEIEIGRPQ